MNSSPTKRRVLGSLDVNAPSPNSRPAQLKDAKPASLSPQKASISIAPATTVVHESEKRQATMADGEPPAKKACLSTPERELQSAALSQEQTAAQRDTDRRQPASPAASSVFDESTLDTSQATNLTEPDHDVAVAAAVTAQLPPVAPRPRRRMTHAESKDAAERLRLRFALAKYKVATGQADVPLEQLQQRPMPGAPLRTRQLPTPAAEREVSPSTVSSGGSQSDEGEEEVIQNSQESVSAPAARRDLPNFASPEKGALPRLPPTSAAITPRRKQIEEEDDKLTSSAIRGGAANGLLSLSLARS